MNRYKVAVVEDDKKSQSLLSSFIDRYAKENGASIQIEIFDDGVNFLEKYSPDFDVVFMDIEMPALNGIDTAKELRILDEYVVLIFVTNMSQYAINGYEVNALDFVLKPISYFSFSLKIKKALSYSLRQKNDGICLKTTEGPVKLRTADIYFLETDKHYIIIHTSRGDYKMRASMTETEEIFKNKSFARGNASYLVNLAYVSKIKKDTVLVGEWELSVSRARKTPFFNALTRYTGGNKID